MKKRIIGVIVLCILLVSFSAYAINFTPEETYNSVVVVYSATGVGSGFSIKENIIITNAHVVENNRLVEVGFYDGTTTEGTVIKTDAEKDLALIAVDKKITPLNINTENVKIGQEVYAIGAPKDMPYTMTKGIVSALDRELGQNKYIQIDASVNSGNSGGPLVDEDGNVIGIITLKASNAEGMGFALSTGDINNFTDGVKADISETEGEAKGAETETKPKENETAFANSKIQEENDLLKIAICISVVLNIVLGLLCLELGFKNHHKKRKDDFDFEIEIEE